MEVLEKLKETGWFLSEEGLAQCREGVHGNDVRAIIRNALDTDLREIGTTSFPDDVSRAKGATVEGPLVFQIQKLRNVGAPKANEESGSAPRMLRLILTDGKLSFNALEMVTLPRLSLNTPPGTKVCLNGSVPVSNGFLLLRPSCITVLGGNVAALVEKWDVHRSLAKHNRGLGLGLEGGPPPWIPFGQKRMSSNPNDKNFKSLGGLLGSDKEGREDSEFEAQRKDAIAEAARGGSKKVFGGGNKHMLDRSVQQVVDAGFSVDQAQAALARSNREVDRAIRNLQRVTVSDSSGEGFRKREPRSKGKEAAGGDRRKRNDDSDEVQSRPSGPVSLFAFLEDKLPASAAAAASVTPKAEQDNKWYNPEESRPRRYDNRGENRDNRYENRESRYENRDSRSNRGGFRRQPQRFQDQSDGHSRGRNYDDHDHNYNRGRPNQPQPENQKPPRFQNRNNNNNNSSTTNSSWPSGSFVQGSWSNNSYEEKRDTQPPRVEPQHDLWGSMDGWPPRSESQPQPQPQPPPQQQPRNFPPPFSQPSMGFQSSNTSVAAALQSYGGYSWPSGLDTSTPPPQPSQPSYIQQHQPPPQQQQHQHQQQQQQQHQQHQQQHQQQQQMSQPPPQPGVNGFAHQWKVGDKCLAQYWKDNKYYLAEVTNVTQQTCVVHYLEYGNQEEVYQHDCIPLPDCMNYHVMPSNPSSGGTFMPFSNGQFSGSVEFRRGGNRPYFKYSSGGKSGDPRVSNGNQIMDGDGGGGMGGGVMGGGEMGGEGMGMGNRERRNQWPTQQYYMPPAQRK